MLTSRLSGPPAIYTTLRALLASDTDARQSGFPVSVRLDAQADRLLRSHGGFVRAFSEFLDHFSGESRNVVGLATGY